MINNNYNLSESQQKALELVQQGENVFITGPAGTGKSFLLNCFRDIFGEKLAITSSTGISAVNIKGSTIYSWSGIGLGNKPPKEILKDLQMGKFKNIRKRIRETQMLAIDEISMIPSNIFNLLNFLFKEIRGNNLMPFGGIQLILFGDFFQLPPVQKEEEIIEFCFESDTWKESDIKIIELKEIYRQTDIELISLLNHMRFGEITPHDTEILKSRINVKSNNKVFKPTILGTHNRQIEEINRKELMKLPGELISYKATYRGDDKKIEFLKKNCIANEILELKINSQVMMLKNTYVKQGIINGSIGIVKDFNKYNYPIVEFANGKVIPIEPEEWCLEKFNETTRELEVEAAMRQVPLILSWAITIHKSQGMTLDCISCNLVNAFADGQIYVALSRVKSLEGLFIEKIDINKIKANPKVIEFYKKNIY